MQSRPGMVSALPPLPPSSRGEPDQHDCAQRSRRLSLDARRRPAGRRGGQSMGDENTIEEDLSIGHGFDLPPVPVDVGWDILVSNPVQKTIRLTPAWSKTPIIVPLPLRLWNSRCLILNGIADAKALSKVLGREVLEVDETPGPDALYAAKPG